ncbi:MAG TPA: TetR/AcrR family transcriptional regulator [Bacteroidales bacterium]|nr:TetR/AcrR family transcriptional regulator [Bacteroidales bacterium]
MRKSKIKRRLLIREGYKLMRKNGYQATSIDEIVNNLKIPKGSFYYYFKNKEDFALEVLEYYVTIVLKRIEKTLVDPMISPKQRIIKLYSDYIDIYTNKGGAVYGNFASNIRHEFGDKNQDISKMVSNYFQEIKRLHINCLHQARRAGEIERSQDVEKLAKLIIYSWEGAILRANMNNNIKSLFVFRELIRDFILK